MFIPAVKDAILHQGYRPSTSRGLVTSSLLTTTLQLPSPNALSPPYGELWAQLPILSLIQMITTAPKSYPERKGG